MQIVKDLPKEGIRTRCTVMHLIFSWTKGTRLEDQRRSERPSVITESIADYLDWMLEDNGEISAVKLPRLITKKFSKKISAQTF